MKFIITESKLDRLIRKNLDQMFDVEDINWTHPYEYDDETGEEYEDPNRIQFYFGDYGDGDVVFQWYDRDYWGEGSKRFYSYRENSPIVEIEDPFLTRLNGLFGDKWYEPFKEWFREKFDVRVNKIEDEIYNKRKSI